MVYRSTNSQRICLLTTETPIPMLISYRSSTQLINLLLRCVDRTVHQNGIRHIEKKMKNGLRSHSIHQNTNTCQYTKQQHFRDKIPCIHHQHLQIESVEETYLLRLKIPCLNPSALWSLVTTTSASSGKYNYRAVGVRGWSTLDVCFSCH